MEGLIGNTPMIEILYKYKGETRKVYAKLEYYNLTGSIKDRMVSYVIHKNKKNGNIKEGIPFIEATSGNTGISLAALGAYYGHPVYIFMPDFVSEERIRLIRSYGAHVTLVSKEEGSYNKCIELADAKAKETGGYRLSQFENIDNTSAHYTTTGTEILKQLKEVDGFISSYGTGGTFMGAGLKLKDVYDPVKLAIIEPTTMSLLTENGAQSSHKIDGISDGFIPPILDKKVIDSVYLIDDEDAINMSRIFARKLGLGVGFSSGANFLGSVLFEEDLGGNIVTIFPDDSKKYLSTGIADPVNTDPHFLSNSVELLSYQIL